MADTKTGLKVNVDWDTIDEIFETNLLYMYNSLLQEMVRYKAKKKLKEWELEDLAQFERVCAAIETLGAYAVYEFDKKAKKYVKQQLR